MVNAVRNMEAWEEALAAWLEEVLKDIAAKASLGMPLEELFDQPRSAGAVDERLSTDGVLEEGPADEELGCSFKVL